MNKKIEELKDIILKACDDKLGRDINTIKLQGTTMADYFVVVTGNNRNHTQAIADEVEEQVEKHGYTVRGKEGFRDGGWILLDCGDIIVHIFTEEQREYYSIEKLWKEAEA